MVLKYDLPCTDCKCHFFALFITKNKRQKENFTCRLLEFVVPANETRFKPTKTRVDKNSARMRRREMEKLNSDMPSPASLSSSLSEATAKRKTRLKNLFVPENGHIWYGTAFHAVENGRG